MIKTVKSVIFGNIAALLSAFLQKTVTLDIVQLEEAQPAYIEGVKRTKANRIGQKISISNEKDADMANANLLNLRLESFY